MKFCISVSNMACGKWPTFSKTKQIQSHLISLKVLSMSQQCILTVMLANWTCRLMAMIYLWGHTWNILSSFIPQSKGETLTNWSEFSRKVLRCLEGWRRRSWVYWVCFTWKGRALWDLTADLKWALREVTVRLSSETHSEMVGKIQ